MPGLLAQNQKERHRTAPLPRKTSYAAQVGLHRCSILRMSKRKIYGTVPDWVCQYFGLAFCAVTLALFLRHGGPISP